ncbi:30S ribosomal protein S14 [Gemmatirosa kalamazoonensis]|uniref:Small ribosomal subunit protein uS14 n=1 Tax=Gemmatirosa kalamazoonensis TaxID=861299 RepID=W0RGU8_9BACT|nr:30S ribosomal protein S14 [Gemmatirosa kalamazoonensis]AHG90324.1 30S ribosomal protein S14 [Gemmatirosa kalamazoonensis]
MAKTSKIVKNEQRKEIVARYAEKRAALRATIDSVTTSDAEKQEAYAKLRKLPRDSSKTRIRNRCSMTGRPRAYLRQFGLSRITFREMALQGLIPGVRKASW